MFFFFFLDDLSCTTAVLESAWKNKGQVGTYRTFKAFPIKPCSRPPCRLFLFPGAIVKEFGEGGTVVFQRRRQEGV